MLKKCAKIWDEVRTRTPLVHCITNYVTVNDVANIILAGGASPAMCEYRKETGDFVRISSALYLNLGTLTDEQERGMLEAVKGAADAGVPLIIDPVACGVIPYRTGVINRLAECGKITCMKGNNAEIKSLAGLQSQARGVDSLDQGEGIEEACQSLAIREHQIVAATGATDVVTDGKRLALIENGTHLFNSITGAGCMAGGVVAACIGAVPGEPWLAAAAGLIAFSLAGERAAGQSGENPGSFRVMLFDEMYQLRGTDLLNEARVEFRM